MFKQTLIIPVVCGLAFLPSLVLGAQTCLPASIPATTPTAQFIDHANGTLTDTNTGLMWKKCSEGQTWEATQNTCIGGAAGYKWQKALQHAQTVNNSGGYAGKQDWRVPNIKELTSISEKQCITPAINLSVFPNTTNAWFWSSTSNVTNSDNAHYTNLIIGVANWDLKTNGHQLRLVRGGQ